MSISTTARRAAVLTAATALAGAAVAGTALATTQRPTTLAVRVAHGTVSANQGDTLAGFLRTGRTAVDGQAVNLLERVPGTSRWKQVATASTSGTSGSVNFSVKNLTRNEQFELVHPATSAYGRSVSAVVTVHVAPHVSASLRSATVRHGQTTTLTARVTPAAGGQTVYLQRLANHKWSDVAHHSLSSRSVSTFQVGAAKAGKVVYRVRIGASSSHAAAASKPVTLTVS
jgi:hypothetical protein